MQSNYCSCGINQARNKVDRKLGTWFGDNMQLIGFTANKDNFHFVRDLSEEELSNHKKYTPVFMEAKNRFKLFSNS